MAGVDLQKMRDKLNRRKKELEDRKAQGQTLKLKQGENRLRITPPWDDSGEWCFEAWYHYNIGEKPLLCPNKMFKEACPICEYAQQLFETKNAEDRELNKQIYAKRRFFCGVLDLQEAAPTPKIFSFGVELRDTLLAAFDPVDGHGDYTDPLKGKNIKMDVVGEKLARRVTTTINPNPSPIANWASIKGSIINISAKLLADRLTYEQMNNILTGVEQTPEAAAVEEPTVTEEADPVVVAVAEAPKPAVTVAAPAVPTGPPAPAANRTALNAKLDALRKLKSNK